MNLCRYCGGVCTLESSPDVCVDCADKMNRFRCRQEVITEWKPNGTYDHAPCDQVWNSYVHRQPLLGHKFVCPVEHEHLWTNIGTVLVPGQQCVLCKETREAINT